MPLIGNQYKISTSMSWNNSGWQRHWSNIPKHSPSKYVGFAVGVSVVAYASLAVMDVEKEKRKRSLWFPKNPTSTLFTRQHNSTLILSNPNSLHERWKNLKESQRTIIGIVALNSLVFGAWRIPSLSRVMNKYFLHSTASHPVTLLTSTFSHKTFMHFGFNMLALYSFGQILHDRIGREHFLAFYLTSGVFSSLGSHFYKSWRNDYARSLGASGALFGVSAACAANIPNINVSLIFLPFHSFPLDKAMPVIMGIDVIGLVRRWQSLDHAAHLSGAMMGYLFFRFSERTVWKNRRKILRAFGYPLS